MLQPRDNPYVWVTWITGLIAGEKHCEWAPWFRAHNIYDKRPSDFDSAAWTAKHAAMVRKQAELLRDSGYEVFLEDQNFFKLSGKTGVVLSGKPDIIAIAEADALVIDCKTGIPRNSDLMQVLVYMIVLPAINANCRNAALRGRVQYGDSAREIDPTEVTDELRLLVRNTIQRIGHPEPLTRVPSFQECRFCDIGSWDCPVRIDEEPIQQQNDHDLF